jgi:hypothetical protein
MFYKRIFFFSPTLGAGKRRACDRLVGLLPVRLLVLFRIVAGTAMDVQFAGKHVEVLESLG